MKQNKLGYTHCSIINIYIFYELKNGTVNNPDFTAQNGLFGAIKLTKNVDTSNYKYEGYGIAFDSGGSFTIGNITKGKNVITTVLILILVFTQQINHKIFMY